MNEEATTEEAAYDELADNVLVGGAAPSGELGTGPVPVAELEMSLETPVEDAIEQATDVPGADEEDWPR